MKKKWIINDVEYNRFSSLPPLIEKLLFLRGIKTSEEAKKFLSPKYQDLHDPFLFSKMRDAVNLIKDVAQKGDLITIYGDYDADGVPGTAILSLLFKKLGIKHNVYLPHREKEGYGLQISAIEYLAKHNTKLIITCDCGITNIKEVDRAKDLGIRVIITDHHSPPTTLPNAIIIHPSVEKESYPYKYLAGGGVAFKLAQALIKDYLTNDLDNSLRESMLAFEKWLIDLPAISTIADMVPLTGENRIIAKYGLIVLNKTRNLGLRKLIEKAALRLPIKAYNISFQIAPRINSASRMDHANVAYKLLVTDNEQEALKLAAELERNNYSRQKITNHIFEEAMKILEGQKNDKKVLSVLGHDWPTGLLGLVASKLVEKFHLPVMVMSKSAGDIVGSVRSIKKFNFIEALRKVEKYFSKYGGHPMAGGFTLQDADLYFDFLRDIEEIALQELVDQDLTPVLEIDEELQLKDINIEMIRQIKMLEPFGVANPEPKFVSRSVKIVEKRIVGSDNKHLKLKVTDGQSSLFDAIGFGLAEYALSIKEGDVIDIVYNLDINEWNGYKDVQLNLLDIKFE